MGGVVPERDRPLVLLELVARIAQAIAEGAPPVEVEALLAEYRQLREQL